MYVRISTWTGATNIDAIVDYLETKAAPAVVAMAGHRGLAVLKDEAAGTVVVAAYWATAEQLEASTGAVSKLRETVRDIAGGDVSVEVYEAAVTKRFAMPPAGAIARFLRVEGDPSRLDAAIAFWVDEALPATARSAGLASAQLLVDRATGKGISITAWNTQADLDAAAPGLAALADRAREASPGGRATGVEQFTLVSTTAQLDS